MKKGCISLWEIAALWAWRLRRSADGCAYRNSCPLRIAVCETVRPELMPATSGASAACHVAAGYAVV